jgi:hypothetical protein
MRRRGSPSAAPAPPIDGERQLPTGMVVSVAAVPGGYAPRVSPPRPIFLHGCPRRITVNTTIFRARYRPGAPRGDAPSSTGGLSPSPTSLKSGSELAAALAEGHAAAAG